jgi:hypothetical protein
VSQAILFHVREHPAPERPGSWTRGERTWDEFVKRGAGDGAHAQFLDFSEYARISLSSLLPEFENQIPNTSAVRDSPSFGAGCGLSLVSRTGASVNKLNSSISAPAPSTNRLLRDLTIKA